MMLKSISIYKLFNEYDYDLILEGEYISFIHSQNGFGKSTLMRLIYNLFEGNLEKVLNTPFQRLDLCFDDDTCLIVENEDNNLLIQMQKNEVEEELTSDDLKNILKVTYIDPERVTIVTPEGLKPSLEAYMMELTEKIKSAVRDNILSVPLVEDKKKYNDSELEFWSKDLKAKLDFIKRARFEPEMPSGYRFPPTRFEIIENKKDYEDLAFSLDDYINRHYCLAESVIVYMDVVNSIFLNKNIYVNEKGIMNIQMDNGTLLSMENLSSGEKQILILFYRLLFHADPNSLVIIDEPEISLHVSWQQQLGKIFIDIAKLRSLRIIISTHSPTVIHDNWDLAIELKVKDD